MTKNTDSLMRRVAYEMGRAGCTFATADELRYPGRDRAYRAGQRKTQRLYALLVKDGVLPERRHDPAR